jgi:hypothetical protein
MVVANHTTGIIDVTSKPWGELLLQIFWRKANLTRERLGIHISIRVQWFFPRIRASFQVPHIKSCP